MSEVEEQQRSTAELNPNSIVMKFGGTSLEDAAAIRRAGQIVRQRLAQRPVVVVSALSSVTDQLLDAGRLAAKGQLAEASLLLLALQRRHGQVVLETAGPVATDARRTRCCLGSCTPVHRDRCGSHASYSALGRDGRKTPERASSTARAKQDSDAWRFHRRDARRDPDHSWPRRLGLHCFYRGCCVAGGAHRNLDRCRWCPHNRSEAVS